MRKILYNYNSKLKSGDLVKITRQVPAYFFAENGEKTRNFYLPNNSVILVIEVNNFYIRCLYNEQLIYSFAVWPNSYIKLL